MLVSLYNVFYLLINPPTPITFIYFCTGNHIKRIHLHLRSLSLSVTEKSSVAFFLIAVFINFQVLFKVSRRSFNRFIVVLLIGVVWKRMNCSKLRCESIENPYIGEILIKTICVHLIQTQILLYSFESTSYFLAAYILSVIFREGK